MTKSELSSTVADSMVDLLFGDGPVRRWESILIPGTSHGNLLDAVGRYCDARGARAIRPELTAIGEHPQDHLGGTTGDEVSVITGDFLAENPGIDDTFDYLLCVPPDTSLERISLERRKEYATNFGSLTMADETIDPDILYLEQGLRHLGEGGRGVFLTHPDLAERDREALNDEQLLHRIEEIVLLSPTEFDSLDGPKVLISITSETPSAAEAPFRYSPEDIEANLCVRNESTNPYTAGAIMTDSPVGYGLDELASTVFFDLHTKGFDAAPVYEDPSNESGLKGYISRQSLRSETESTVRGQVQELTERDLVDKGTHLSDILGGLAGRRVLFVGTERQIDGIITRFDLNKLPTYLYLFDCFSEFEIGLRRLIRSELPDWDSKTSISIRSRKTGDLLPDDLAGAELGELLEIVDEGGLGRFIHPDLDSYETSLVDLKYLRNAVAHYNPIVHTMSGHSTGDSIERGAYQLYRENRFLQLCIAGLEIR